MDEYKYTIEDIEKFYTNAIRIVSKDKNNPIANEYRKILKIIEASKDRDSMIKKLESSQKNNALIFELYKNAIDRLRKRNESVQNRHYDE